MTLICHVLAPIGAITLAVLAYREARFQWKSRNWKPTPYLGGPGL